MSGSDSELFKTATRLAQEAYKLDNAKQAEAAADKYLQAAEVLNNYIKFCKNPALSKLAREKAEQYLARARILSNIGNKKQKVTTGSPQSKSSKDGKDEEKDEPEMSQEEKELRQTISGTVVTDKPSVTWADVAGMEDAKQSLRESVVLPLAHPELFQGARKPWQGILLFGPPGCGKTLLAKAAANECSATFFAVDSASIVSKWLGESEKLMKTLFQVAYMDAPSLVFIDEIDSIAGKRGEGNEGGGERRIKTQLLQEMQGVKSKRDKLITLLGATNRPWDIDSAILRRFEKKIYIGLPNSAGRKQIFDLSTKGVEKDTSVNTVELGELTEGYTGSDIASICREVVMLPVRELDAQGILDQKNGEIKVRAITQTDFETVIKRVKPVVSKKELDEFEAWRQEFGG